MTITVGGTSITFNDATTQTTAPVNTNANVTSVSAGTGISVSSTTGAVVVSSTVSGGVSSINAQTGAVTTTSVNDIGSVMLLALYVSSFTAYYSNQTVAGSSLYYSSAITQYNNNGLAFNGSITGSGTNQYTAPTGSGAFGQQIQRNQSGNVGRQPPAGMTSCSGTWRLMSPVGAGGSTQWNPCCGITANYYYVSLWVRVS